MTPRPELSRLLQAVGGELDSSAATARRLEDVVTGLLHGHRLTPAVMEALQGLDSLTQHLEQLAQLVRDLARAGDPCARDLETALNRLNLAALSSRLAGVPAPAPAHGELELW